MSYYTCDYKTTIDVPALETEYRELVKTKNAWFHHHSVDPEAFKDVELRQLNDLKKDIKRFTDSHGEAIDKLLDPSKSSCHYTNYDALKHIGDMLDVNKASEQNLKETYLRYISDVGRRMASIRLLVDEYQHINSVTMNASMAKQLATRYFKGYVETNIGWSNDILFENGTGLIDYLEEPRKYAVGYVGWTATIGVDHTWIDKVKNNDIQVVDIAGKMYLTLDADEILEHEMVDEDVRLFQAKLFTTKVPKDFSNWSMKPGQGKECLLFEDRVIAVQKLPSGERRITTGKNISWAIRTMKQRMKKEMMKLMDI